MFFSHSFWRSDFTYGVTKDQNVEMFFDKGDFRRSDFTYGVKKDHNVENWNINYLWRITYGYQGLWGPGGLG